MANPILRASIRVAAAVVICENQILLAQRPPHKSWGGYWEFPGGKIELGETGEQALRRELKEELNIAAGPMHFLGEYQHLYDFGLVILEVYVVAQKSFQCETLEHSQVTWVKWPQLNDFNLVPADIKVLPDLEKHLAW